MSAETFCRVTQTRGYAGKTMKSPPPLTTGAMACGGFRRRLIQCPHLGNRPTKVRLSPAEISAGAEFRCSPSENRPLATDRTYVLSVE